MDKNIEKIIHTYDNFSHSYEYAFIGIPKGYGGLKKPYYGTLKKFKKAYPNFTFKEKLPTLFYMHGSIGLTKGKIFRKYIVEDANFIFFAPNSFKVRNRPTYKSPSTIEKYQAVHKFRQAEIYYNLEKLKNVRFIDCNNMFLMGNSEGGLAAAYYKGKEFKARIVTAFSCEEAYYSQNFTIGAKKKDPFLNIIGTQDEYFSNDSETNKHYEVDGHGTQALLKFKKAKVIILPQTKHDLTLNPYVKEDIVNFLKFWSKH